MSNEAILTQINKLKLNVKEIVNKIQEIKRQLEQGTISFEVFKELFTCSTMNLVISGTKLFSK